MDKFLVKKKTTASTASTATSEEINEKLPTLYSKSSTGKVIIWNIYIDCDNPKSKSCPATIVTKYGQKDGKITTTNKEITKGKNIGKKNETSPYEQALSEANSKWKKKFTEGCVLSEDSLNKFQISPMLAHDFNKRNKDIVFPCFIQPKLDGVRCLITIDTKTHEIVSYSRTGRKYNNTTYITKELEKRKIFYSEVFKNLNIDCRTIVLDGELYSHTIEGGFDKISGICRKNTLKSKDEEILKQIEYHIYDFFTTSPETSKKLIYSKRLEILQQLNLNDSKYLKLVETVRCEYDNAVLSYLTHFINEKYEGIILRNAGAEYSVGNRSKHLQKLKEFVDSEFKIVDFVEGTGIEKGCVIWICEYTNCNGDIDTFNVRPRGEHESRKEQFINGNKYIGKLLTVRYFELTKNNCPRFPVGICIRDYE